MKIIDLHCDTLWKCGNDKKYSFFDNDGHITENGLVKGDYMAQCFAIFTSVKYKGEDAFEYFEARYQDAIEIFNSCKKVKIAANRQQMIENTYNGIVSAVLTVENAEFLNNKIGRLQTTDKRGFRVFGLIHNDENSIGYYHGDNNPNLPLKSFGKDVIDAINSTNMFVDVSHLNCGGFWDVINISKKPVIATHSACRTLKDHSRNLYDDQIKAIAKSGGIVGIPFYDLFLKKGEKTEIADIIRHLEHLINTGGENIAALGTDFDGIDNELFLKDCSEMPMLINELIKKFGSNLTEKICYKNALRVI